MSKSRPQSLKRSLSRALKGREKAMSSDGQVIFKEPRITTEFINEFGKLLVLKRAKTGHNKNTLHRRKYKRPYYYLAQSI